MAKKETCMNLRLTKMGSRDNEESSEEKDKSEKNESSEEELP